MDIGFQVVLNMTLAGYGEAGLWIADGSKRSSTLWYKKSSSTDREFFCTAEI